MNDNKRPDPIIIKLTKTPVRLSFPALFEPTAFKNSDGTTGKAGYSAKFILDKVRNAADIKALEDGIKKVMAQQWPGKTLKLKQCCLHDGSEKPDTDGYGDKVMFLSASNSTRPAVVDRDLSPLVAEDGKPYAGCYVYATVRLWAQDNGFGKGVNASLRNVQFVKDGETFGEKAPLAEEDFSVVTDDGNGAI